MLGFTEPINVEPASQVMKPVMTHGVVAINGSDLIAADYSGGGS